MNLFFSTPERIARLQLVADQWLGTQFMPNAAIKGAGVSCQKLLGAIYIESGFLPEGFVIPEGPMDWAHANTRSLIAEFIATRPEFAEVQRAGSRGRGCLAESVSLLPARCPMPGDMVGFKIGGCIHHCGMVVDKNGRFIHVMKDALGVRYNNLRDATYFSRIGAIWRPVNVSGVEWQVSRDADPATRHPSPVTSPATCHPSPLT